MSDPCLIAPGVVRIFPSILLDAKNARNLSLSESRRGFILPLALALLVAIAILAFSYNFQAREEAFRVHRLYWNELLTKSAEGVAEEAFAWFFANPGNELIAYLGKRPGGRSSLSLLGKLEFPRELEEFRITLGECTLSVVCESPFFEPANGSNGFPSGFSAKDEGYIFPDAKEMTAMLKVEVEVFCYSRHFSRRYEVLRELRSISLLPAPFSQFTLFVKNKLPCRDGDPNHFKMKLGAVNWLEYLGYGDEVNHLGNPMILIHSPQDKWNERPIISGNNTVAPTFDRSVDLLRRGWVFLGGADLSASVDASRNEPFQAWFFNILAGHTTHGQISTLPVHRYFGELWMLSTYQTMVYHTKMPGLQARGIPPTPNLFSSPPFSEDMLGKAFQGCLLHVSQFPYWSAYGVEAANYQDRSLFGYKYYFDEILNPKHKDEPIDGSLLRPFGDLFPDPGNRAQVIDRRSPTPLLGPTFFRSRNLSYIWQMSDYYIDKLNSEEELKDSIFHQPSPDQNTLKMSIPYFPIIGNTLDPALPILGARFPDDPSKTVTEPLPPDRKFAGVQWQIDHVLGTLANYKTFMSKPITGLPAQIFELILQNNLADEPAPTGWYPAPKYLKTIPGTVDCLDLNGATVEDTATDFFFKADGRAFAGNQVLLKDEDGNRLAGGNLSAIWPFSPSTTLADGRFNCTKFDLRQKTTYLVKTPAEFFDRFVVKETPDQWILDLKGGVVTVCGGDLKLVGPPSTGRLLYREGGMLIVNDGELQLAGSLVREPPGATGIPLTLATAANGRHIWLSPKVEIHAYLISSGTLKRGDGAGTGYRIQGGAAVRYLDFRDSPDSIFLGHPSEAGERSDISWDPDFNLFSPEAQFHARRFLLGPRKSFWKSEPL
ncbi:MAG: hypothetical protein HQM08_26285 [Candidatus Riflebacteria bacterium]|nr:hypothetical protein [Candidatus Riflebacteria bacterium]